MLFFLKSPATHNLAGLLPGWSFCDVLGVDIRFNLFPVVIFLRNDLINVILDIDRSGVTLVARSKILTYGDNKYMTASTEITNIEIFAFMHS